MAELSSILSVVTIVESSSTEISSLLSILVSSSTAVSIVTIESAEMSSIDYTDS